jgi:hypothetical protein
MSKIEIELLEKLTKDKKNAATTLKQQEARYLVDSYYQVQHFRIATGNQTRILEKETAKDEEPDEPHEVLGFFNAQFRVIENEIKSILDVYVRSQPIGRWLMSITGIGPVIAAGLIAHIDIKKCQTAGAIWRYAGLDPSVKWNKKQKRPWNARLKTLCWKIGQSFCKVSSNPKDVYGRIYIQRKAYEEEKNEDGEYAEYAKKMLEDFNFKKDTKAYKFYTEGKLPPGHVNQRALRYAVKLFLSHLFQVWYEMENGEKPPKPFAIAQLGHAHMIEPPNWPMIEE